MTTVSDLYRANPCPEIIWFLEIELGGAGIPPFALGTAYNEVADVRRAATNHPVFDFRADFTDSSTNVSAINFAIDPEDFTLRRQLLDGFWEGRPGTFYIGLRGLAREDFVPIFTGVVDSIQFDTETGTVALRAENAGLKQEIRQAAYLGDGTSYEGGPELSGNKKRKGFGIVSNARPQLTNLGRDTYQYSEGDNRGCIAVYDNAIELLRGPEIGELESLDAIDPPADGTFRDQPSTGFIMLGQRPSDASNITCTFRGSTDEGGYQSTTAGIVLQLFRLAGYSLSDLDGPSYQELALRYPYEVGIDIEEGETYQTAIKRLLAGAHADFGVGPTGLFEFWLYRTGAGADCDLTIPASAIVVDDDGRLMVERGPNLPSINQLVINGARNNTVQEQVAQGADREQAAFASKQFRPYGAVNDPMTNAFPDAQAVTIDTFQYGRGDSALDARRFHNEIASTFLGKRGTWLVTIGCHQFKVRRGMRVCIDLEELGLERGPLYVERVREFVSTNQTELTLARTDAI